MIEADALAILSAIAQPVRLRTVVLLAAANGDGMASSDLADAVGVPRNLMSTHLAILSKAGIVASTKTGRTVVYGLRAAALRQACDFIETLIDEEEGSRP